MAATRFQPSAAVRTACGPTVGTLFAEVARRNPDRIALSRGDSSWTYRELDLRVNQLANALRQRGVSAGDRIGLLARNCIEYMEIELAAAKLGAITAALNWRLSAREMGHCIALAEPVLLLAQAEFSATLSAAMQAGQGAGSIPMLTLGEDYEAAVAASDPIEPEINVDPEDGLLIIYTSGTTGLPKGALLSHRAVINRCLIFASELEVPRQHAFVAWTPMFHMGASDFSYATLLRGGTVFVVDGFQSDVLIAIIERELIHYFPVVPGMIAQFASALKAKHVQPRGIGFIGAMADLVPREQLIEISRLLNAPYLNTFGSTETGIPPATGSFLPIGEVPASLAKRQNNFCVIRLADSDGHDVPDGQPGELLIRGPSLLAIGRTKRRPRKRDGWFHLAACRT